MEKDYSPLSLACVKTLSDKSYDKRRQAAGEIEKMAKDFAVMKNTEQIRKLLKVLGQDFTMSQMTNWRKGGIIGLAATAMALGKEASNYTEQLILPILHCFSDTDSRVRYYACEGLYNVTKVARSSVLLHFNEIFSALSKLAADPDQNVKSGTEMLDRLLKDIVTESTSFNLVTFMPLLRERIYTKNTHARQFVLSWISILHAVPDISMIIFLPDLLDGLLNIMEDPTMEIKKMCETVLGEFLREIIKNPSIVNFSSMINVLISHSQSQSQSKDELLQLMSVTWMKEFVTLAQTEMLPYASGILTAILPCLAYEEESRKNIREISKAINYNLMKLITTQPQQLTEPTPTSKDKGDNKDKEGNEDGEGKVDLCSVVKVLTANLETTTAVPTKVAVLRWIYHLYVKMGDQMFRYTDDTFPVLLKTLSDTSDEVVLLALEVLSEIVSIASKTKLSRQLEGLPQSNSGSGPGFTSKSQSESPSSPQLSLSSSTDPGSGPVPVSGIDIHTNPYFNKFIVSLLALFSADKALLEDRGSFIIRQLCVLLSAEAIYKSIAEILLLEENLKFAHVMVETLNTILLTSCELFELRSKLRGLLTKEDCQLFSCLYRTWAHDPVATVALCFLTQNYSHACHIIRTFGQLEVTVDFLIEIDKLVQLIESPIFTYLRLDLLDGHHHTELVQALYGLLMLLPQSEGFHVLQRRLNCVPTFHLPPSTSSPSGLAALGGSKVKGQEREFVKELDFDQLLQHFTSVQDRHRKAKQIGKATELIQKGMKALDF